MVQLSHPYMTTGKIISLSRQTFVSKVRSLLYSVISRFVIAFIPRSKCLNFVASVTICSYLEPKKIKSVTVSIVSSSICHEVKGLDTMFLVFWMLNFKSVCLIVCLFNMYCFLFNIKLIYFLIYLILSSKWGRKGNQSKNLLRLKHSSKCLSSLMWIAEPLRFLSLGYFHCHRIDMNTGLWSSSECYTRRMFPWVGVSLFFTFGKRNSGKADGEGGEKRKILSNQM